MADGDVLTIVTGHQAFAAPSGGGVDVTDGVDTFPATTIQFPEDSVSDLGAGVIGYNGGGIVTEDTEIADATLEVSGSNNTRFRVRPSGQFDVTSNDEDVTINAGSGTIDLATTRLLLGAFSVGNLIRFDSPNIIWANSVTEPTGLNTSNFAIWLDDTNGASKLMIKARSADGTVVVGEVALT